MRIQGNTHDNHNGAERNDEDAHMAASQLTQPPRTPSRALGNNLRNSRYQDRTRKVHRATCLEVFYPSGYVRTQVLRTRNQETSQAPPDGTCRQKEDPIQDPQRRPR